MQPHYQSIIWWKVLKTAVYSFLLISVSNCFQNAAWSKSIPVMSIPIFATKSSYGTYYLFISIFSNTLALKFIFQFWLAIKFPYLLLIYHLKMSIIVKNNMLLSPGEKIVFLKQRMRQLFLFQVAKCSVLIVDGSRLKSYRCLEDIIEKKIYAVLKTKRYRLHVRVFEIKITWLVLKYWK